MKDLYLVILADMDLLSLPLETIAQLRQLPNVSSISRDFSLQVLKHRAARNLTDDTGLLEQTAVLLFCTRKGPKQSHTSRPTKPHDRSIFKFGIRLTIFRSKGQEKAT